MRGLEGPGMQCSLRLADGADRHVSGRGDRP